MPGSRIPNCVWVKKWISTVRVLNYVSLFGTDSESEFKIHFAHPGHLLDFILCQLIDAKTNSASQIANLLHWFFYPCFFRWWSSIIYKTLYAANWQPCNSSILLTTNLVHIYYPRKAESSIMFSSSKKKNNKSPNILALNASNTERKYDINSKGSIFKKEKKCQSFRHFIPTIRAINSHHNVFIKFASFQFSHPHKRKSYFLTPLEGVSAFSLFFCTSALRINWQSLFRFEGRTNFMHKNL